MPAAAQPPNVLDALRQAAPELAAHRVLSRGQAGAIVVLALLGVVTAALDWMLAARVGVAVATAATC